MFCQGFDESTVLEQAGKLKQVMLIQEAIRAQAAEPEHEFLLWVNKRIGGSRMTPSRIEEFGPLAARAITELGL